MGEGTTAMERLRSILTSVTLLGILVAAAAFLVAADVLAMGPPRPDIAIITPEDNSITDSDSLAVEVQFKAGAGQSSRGGPSGNVQLITLEIDGSEVGHYNNPPHIKEGTHTFDVDISAYPDGPIALQAHGFQGNERAGLKGSSSQAKITIDRSPPETTTIVIGTVGDDEANMVPGARVSIHRDGDEIAQTVTDVDGEFEIELTPDDSQVSITARPPAPAFHGAATQMLTPLSGGTYDLHFVLWSEHSLTLTSEDPEDLQDTVTLSTFDSSVMISGIPKDLNITGGSARAFSPTYMPDAFPGDFATRQPGFESGLISAGFASVNLLQQDEDGNESPVSELRDNDGEPVWVELRFRIDQIDWHAIQDGAHFAHLPGYVDRPDRISAPLYYFDEDLGDWLLAPEFGWLEDSNGPIPPSELPAIQNGEYPRDIFMTGKVNHFTWYNLDFPSRDACMTGRLIDEGGDTLTYATLKFRSLPGGAVTTGGTPVSFFSNVIGRSTDGSGRFQVRVPRTETGPGDDWNDNGMVDTFAIRGELDHATGLAVFDNNGQGYRAPNFPEETGCGDLGDIVVELKQAKLVEFEITFLEEDTNEPLFVDPPSFSPPNLAIATLLDTRVPLNGKLWQKTCQSDTGFSACNHQSSTNSSGVANIKIPVLVDEDPGPLDIIEDLSGAFAYHKLRPDLGFDAYEFAGINYLVPENKKKLTINVEVERRGPPDIEILQPDSDESLVFLFDEEITLEASGTDVNDNSIDYLDFFYWSDTNQARLLAQGRTNTIVAGTSLGSGTGHGIVAHGIDYWGWLGTEFLSGIEVATVVVEVDPTSLALVPGDTEPLTADVTGANNTSVNWTSSSLGVATVNASGLVTAVNPGSTTITARSAADPTKTAFVEIEVEDLVAAFSVTPEFADTETEFSFDGSLSTGDIDAYAWDFGDGSSGSGETVTHTYASADTYMVTLTVTGASGATAKTTQSLSVGTTDPVASFIASPASGNPPLEVSFDASASFDPDGDIVSWEWDFGDGSSGSGEITSHTYTLAGTFTVELAVTDDNGATGTTTREVRINQAPTASFTVNPNAGPALLTVTVNASASGDPDGQIVRYSWDFGDGSVIEDGDVLEGHTYTVPGIYTLALTVEDDGGLTDATERSVTVTATEFNLPPVVTITGEVIDSEPYLTYRFDASDSFAPSGSIVDYVWNFGDASEQVSGLDPEVTHRYTFAGDFDVALQVEDSQGLTAQISLQVSVDLPSTDGIAIAAGDVHSLGVRGDGTVWAWGYNTTGQLGNGNLDSIAAPGRYPLPAQVPGIESAISIVAGRDHSLALRDDGTVWAWGWNQFGQLGDGTTTNRAVPVKVDSLDEVVAIEASETHSMALRSDGTIWSWGLNTSGQLGHGFVSPLTSPVPVPAQVIGLDDVVAIAVGEGYSLALDSEGAVWGWGSNGFGQLGNGTNTSQAVPVKIDSLDDVSAIAARSTFSLALHSDGTLWAWGFNGDGVLGIEPVAGQPSLSRNVPVKIESLTDVIAISAGRGHALAILEDGSVWGWGRNNERQASGASEESRLFIPMQVPDLDDVVSASANQWHSMALKSDGSVWAWGYGFHGQLGDGEIVEAQGTPVRAWWD
jgi:alpha-tubulin suppressor-like RCC1 family protein/PKD repeat protein